MNHLDLTHFKSLVVRTSPGGCGVARMGNHVLRHGFWLVMALGLVALGLVACGGTGGETVSSRAVAAPAIALEPCQLSAPGISQRVSAECGVITVYEDRAAGTGRTIDLRIALLPAVSRTPAPDPLFFLTGGPGQAATESFVQVAGAFYVINRTRDIVLVDQRGTGGSNPLRCPLPDTSTAEEVAGGEAATAAIESSEDFTTRWLRSCAAVLDADPTLYTTNMAMDDLDQVRTMLGYEQINLYGVSYGTRAALTYLRHYPQRVRTLILDGVVPPDLALGLNVARNAQRALDLIFARCAAEPACAAAFPDLPTTFAQLMRDLEARPIELTLPHPVSGNLTHITLGRDDVAFAVRLHSYSPETAALLPLLIHAAQVDRSWEGLAAQTLLVSEQLSDSISVGMNLSVLCTEDAPYLTEDAAAAANANTYYGALETARMMHNCQVWPRGPLLATAKEPVASDLPVLLLSGEVDPVTPPANGERVARELPNSLHIIAEGQGHGIAARGCIPQLMQEFIDQGSADGLNTSCVSDLEPTPFFLSFAGPEP